MEGIRCCWPASRRPLADRVAPAPPIVAPQPKANYQSLSLFSLADRSAGPAEEPNILDFDFSVG
jgi:hypothetical protein